MESGIRRGSRCGIAIPPLDLQAAGRPLCPPTRHPRNTRHPRRDFQGGHIARDALLPIPPRPIHTHYDSHGISVQDSAFERPCAESQIEAAAPTAPRLPSGRPWETSVVGKTMGRPSSYGISRDVSRHTHNLQEGRRGTNRATVSVAGVTVTNSRGQTVLRITPNEYPTNTFRVQKEAGDDSLIDYIQVRGLAVSRE